MNTIMHMITTTITTMLEAFFIRAVLAGIGVALAAAPLGCFVVWRRMAYFGDATAHAAILGVALAFALGLPVFAGALVIALLMALMVGRLSGRGLAVDTLLGVAAHSSLAFGIVAISFLDVRVDLMGFLFGDILTVSWSDLWIIWSGAALVLLLLWWRWSALLTATLNADLAHAAGIDPRREQLALTIALAIVVAVAIKVVGVLLIASMLVIPAAAARRVTHTPETMAAASVSFGVVSVLGGLLASWYLDTPAGPSIVCVAALIFFATSLAGSMSARPN